MTSLMSVPFCQASKKKGGNKMTNSILTVNNDKQPTVVRFLDALFVVADSLDYGGLQGEKGTLAAIELIDHLLDSMPKSDELTAKARRHIMLLNYAKKYEGNIELGRWYHATLVVILLRKFRDHADKLAEYEQLTSRYSELSDCIQAFAKQGTPTLLDPEFVKDQKSKISHQYEMLCERSRQYRNDQRELRDKIYHELSHGCDGVKCRDCEDFDPIQFFGLDPQFPAPIGVVMSEAIWTSHELNILLVDASYAPIIETLSKNRRDIAREMLEAGDLDANLTLWRAIASIKS